MRETGETLKGSNSSSADAGEKGSISEESNHQNLKHLVTQLPALVDSLTKDCREYERSLRHERFKMQIMWRIHKDLESENKEMLKRKVELECELDAKKMKIEELTMKLEESVDAIDGLQDLNQQLLTKERLSNIELQNARKVLIASEKKQVLTRNPELECELDAKQMRIEELTMKLEENVDVIDGLQDLNQLLLVKERLSNTELQNARKELIKVLSEMLDDKNDVDTEYFGLKRMGEIDHEAFLKSCRLRYSAENADIKAAKLCSEWQGKLKNPQWHPFKIVMRHGGNQEVVNEEDPELKNLKKKWSDEIYYAVTTALVEINEYNPNGGHVISELWNYRANRKATLQEVISHVFKQQKFQLQQMKEIIRNCSNLDEEHSTK